MAVCLKVIELPLLLFRQGCARMIFSLISWDTVAYKSEAVPGGVSGLFLSTRHLGRFSGYGSLLSTRNIPDLGIGQSREMRQATKTYRVMGEQSQVNSLRREPAELHRGNYARKRPPGWQWPRPSRPVKVQALSRSALGTGPYKEMSG